MSASLLPSSALPLHLLRRFAAIAFLFLLLAFTSCGKRETTVELGNREGVLHLSIGSEPSDLDPQTVTGTGAAVP